ncbi:MAG TPA: T9SS type A sorting domain-containing protein, partial [Bacteroidia bacterium]|nr:T9SS type A sorting domain-containing protein [Bacteroidia bacterium]
MKKIITLFAIVFCLNTKAQTWVTIPDSNFVIYLHQIIPAAMNGNQMNTSSTLVTTTTHSINVNGLGIANLSGIQYITTLTYLNCNNNQLTSLPTLPNSLTYLNCGGNSFANLPTLPNSIDTLNCSSNSITSLPTLPSSLIYLKCGYNLYLTNLPTLPNSLNYLDCSVSNLSSLPALPNSLRTLYCQENSLITLPTLPDSLISLWCDVNRITCFPSFPSTITSIDLDFNAYNCLPNYISAMNASYLAKPLCAAGNSNGCAIATRINQITDINNKVNIYPNPINNNFTIETNNTDKQTLQIFDVNGKLVLTQTINGKTNIDASNLAEGVYNLSLINPSAVVNKR